MYNFMSKDFSPLKLFPSFWALIEQATQNVNEPQQDKTNKMAFAHGEDSDQSGHPPSLLSLHC